MTEPARDARTPAGRTAGVRSLPEPAIDPADVIALVPGTSPEDAYRYASLATLAVTAAVYPTVLPVPLPAPAYAVTLAVAGRFARSGGPGAPVVSESIGAYTYRLATPVAADEAFGLTDAELAALSPWGPRKVYDVSVAGGRAGWPVDWWQRDLDDELAAADAALAAELVEGGSSS